MEYVSYECVEPHKFYQVSGSNGGGDEFYEELIYTDDDGIDHLVHGKYSFMVEEDNSFYGDRILGLHKSGPFYEM